MSIYNPIINKMACTTARPFSKIIPNKYKFPVMGSYTLKLNADTSMKFACNETSYCGKVLFWEGVEGYEYAVVNVFMDVLKNVTTFFDIGANIGYYSLVAKAVNPLVKVVAFEPMPGPQNYFNKNKALNGFEDIVVEAIALSDKKGEMEFTSVINPKFENVKDQLAGDGSLFAKQDGNAKLVKVPVKVDTLDNYVKQNNITSFELMKLDVEAHEDIVLSGATNVLQNFKPIIMCEVLEGKVEERIQNALQKFDYEFYQATDKGLVKQTSIKHDGVTNDYFMVHPDRRGMIEKFIV
jgi:FkbM family methyltransferase